MPDKRKIRYRGQEVGTFTIELLYCARLKGEFDHTAEFFSVRKKTSMPIAGILEDLKTSQPREKELKQMKAAGIEYAKVLTSGNEGDCPKCQSIASKVYKLAEVPEIPPEGCTCMPWCRLGIVAEP